MTIDEARSKMAALTAELYALYENRLRDDPSPCRTEGPAVEKPRCENELRIERERVALAETAAGYPEIREHMWCWTVDVHGTSSNLCSQAALNEGLALLASGEQAVFAELAGGGLARSVTDYITHGLVMRITHAGGGCDGWDLGVSCDHPEMERLTEGLHKQFEKAIRAGLLRVAVKFWGWRFKE